MLDDTDRAIISYLQYDGRAPYTKIAEELDLTEGAVRRRAKNLVESGVMQIVAVVDPHELGLSEAGMIGVTVQPHRIQEIAEEIAQLPEVSYLFQAAGELDLFAEVFCENRQQFVHFLNEKLQKIEGVLSTRTFFILKMHKLSYRWGNAEPPDPSESP
jgi:Lrp/AsnC family transcriptional regulator for asnA, asnC and gidA